jgi:ABC-type polysaccharide/polyol phosphate export permease
MIVEPTVAAHLVQRSRARLAFEDLAEGVSRWWLWGLLAWQDVLLRYRGSVLGPLWITLSMLVTTVALGFLYSKLFHVDLTGFLPFLCLGLLAWGLISGIILETCTVLIQYGSVIKQTRQPFTSYILRVVWRNFLVFFHNMIVYVLVAVYFSSWPGVPLILVSLSGLLLIFVNGVWIGLLLAIFAARFRDIPPIIGSLLQLAFFITPILWPTSQLGTAVRYLYLNPFYPFLAVFRDPLLGEVPDPVLWWIIAGLTVVGWSVTFLVFARFRGRISYWI